MGLGDSAGVPPTEGLNVPTSEAAKTGISLCFRTCFNWRGACGYGPLHANCEDLPGFGLGCLVTILLVSLASLDFQSGIQST
jgi:hypothetical protein